jgi:hypothetical protein
MNANPMEAKDTTHHTAQQTTYLHQVQQRKTPHDKSKIGQVVEIVCIDEKDRAETDATIACYYSTALTPARQVLTAPLSEASLVPGNRLRVYGYGRTWNTGLDGGGSWNRQTSSLERTAEFYSLGSIIAFYHDDDVSGADIKSPDWSALKLELAAHPGSILIVEEVDRLFRTARAASYIQFLIDHGIRLYDCKGFVDEQRLSNRRGHP